FCHRSGRSFHHRRPWRCPAGAAASGGGCRSGGSAQLGSAARGHRPFRGKGDDAACSAKDMVDDNPLTRPGVAHPDITDAGIADLIATFYGRAREDELIGPIFNRAVDDWPEHIAQITDFWSSIMLRTGRYSGRPL